ncbi:Syntaxin-18 [Araneus ventricosus]|uniref:Syntaxin-18 n=1 Tax=Araneus ventricosus TaxID=182803 RepID=A0A4Y2N1J9_ARAVE|nr:Syntaxin-18 [Araneus ventricosus]GBN32752.1 Syntaxin-18 [Araneus ventricosus]GBN32794.1 Syntaxin-18 [Araneus ventricosus]
MDVTALFKACVKTLRTRNKALGIDDKDKSSMVFSRGNKVKSDFAIKAREVTGTITKMRDFLLEHRKDYITMNYILHGSPTMTDSERDKIDSDAQAFMQMCVEVIKTLRQEVKKTMSAQLKEHQEAVVSLIDQYLKAVCKIYSGQKAIRVKQAVDRQKMLRLESDFRKRKSREGEDASPSEPKKTEETNDINSEKESLQNSSYSLTDLSTDSPEVDFSPEELQMFEEENQRLYEEMNTLVDEVREIEGKVVEIGRLQEILSEKVLQQDQDINRIADTVMGTTENIKEGNEELREAMKKNAGFRVYILFFLIVLSFSLLFLDWYSP